MRSRLAYSIPFRIIPANKWLQRGWQISLADESITFKKKEEEKTTIPTAKLISANLAYARELEQIV